MIAGLDGGIVLVTGAASGIGAAIAREAAASGAAGLLLTDRDAAGCAAVADGIGSTCPARTHIADLAVPGAGAGVVAACIGAFGRIDASVNAAGITDRASVADGTLDDWDRLMAINARAPFEVMQGAIRDMAARGTPGSIVNILSINVHCGAPDLGLYAASKAALAALTKNAANAHLAQRIRINGINLGWTDTPGEQAMQVQVLGQGPDWRAAAAGTRPLGRLLTAQEAARHAIWLLSGASAPMTGVCVDLDQSVTGAP